METFWNYIFDNGFLLTLFLCSIVFLFLGFLIWLSKRWNPIDPNYRLRHKLERKMLEQKLRELEEFQRRKDSSE